MQDGNREKIISSEGMLVCSDVSRDATTATIDYGTKWTTRYI